MRIMIDKNDILIYNTPNGNSNVEVYLCDEDIWMTQAALADLFQTSRNNITMHIQNIYKEDELMEESTIKLDLKVQKEGSRTVKRASTIIPNGVPKIKTFSKHRINFFQNTENDWYQITNSYP